MPDTSSAAPADTASPSMQKIVLFITCLTLFFLTCIFSAVNVALPAIGREFNANAILLGWVSTAGLLTSAAILLPMGRLSDILGIKKVFVSGMVLYTLTCTLSVFAASIQMLIALRAMQGVSIAMVVGNALAMVSSLHGTGNRGRALGITSAFVYIGLAVGPLLGGVMTEHLGWRSIFILNIPMGLTAVFLSLWKIKDEWRGAKSERFDVAGSVVFGLAFSSLMYGISTLTTLTGKILIPVGIAGIILFLIWENRTPSPILNIKLFGKNKIFVFSNLAAMISYAATYAVVFIMSLYLQYIKGFSPGTAGLILLAQPAMQALISPVAGRVSDKIESRKVAAAGMAITCAGLVLFSFISTGTPVMLIIVILVLLGGGFAMFVTPNTNAVIGSVDRKVYGMASAMINTMRQIGQMLSMSVIMIILAVYVGPQVITQEYFSPFVASCRISFIIFSVFCFTGIFATLARGNARHQSK
jgi:EmrB/QacA subfamily drug resistance transporter